MKIIEHAPWKEWLDKPSFPKLSGNLSADAVIVGGGLAGIMTAYLLAREGKDVVVLEKKKVGSGATEYTTAFITQDVDTNLSELSDLFGEKYAKLVWQSGSDAIDLIEQIVDDEEIDCDFTRCEVNLYANTKKNLADLDKEQKFIRKMGFKVSPLKQKGLDFNNAGYFSLHSQAKFQPMKFLYGLAAAASELGVRIFQETEVSELDQENGKVITKDKFEVTADQIIVATYQPFHQKLQLFLKKGMYKSFVLRLELPKNLIAEGLYLDNENPYHYFRVDPQQATDAMIIGGEDIRSFLKINPDKCFRALETYLKKILPTGTPYQITHQWTGPILEPSDGLPLIGRVSDLELVATAFSGNGMTYAAIAALILSDMVMGKTNIYAPVYDPNRIPSLRQLYIKGSDYIEEFMRGAAKNIMKKPFSHLT